MDRKDVFEYVKKQYGTVPEYLWKESPESAVLRHKNGKWYAVLMQVKKSKLELEGEGTVDIINVKCEPDMVGVLIETYGFLPGYHMNKEHAGMRRYGTSDNHCGILSKKRSKIKP